MIPERAAETGRLPDPEARQKPRITVFHIYLFFVAARFLASLLISEPVILSDELTYKSMAFGFFSSRDFTPLGLEGIGAPNTTAYLFYPLLLSLSFFFGGNFLVVGKLLNAVLINAAIFPYFGILKDFLPRRRAVWAAALPLLLPSFGFSAYLMAENAFFPLAALGMFLLYRQFSRRRPADAILTTVVAALLVLTKHQAAAFLLAVPSAAALLLAGRRARAADPSRGRDVLSGLAVMALTALAAGAVLELAVPGAVRRMAVIGRVAVRSAVFAFRRLLSVDGGDVYGLARAGAAHAAVVLLLFLIPALAALWTWTKARRSSDRKSAVLASLVLSFFAVSFLMAVVATAILSPAEAFSRLHGRFYAAALPFLWIAFAAFGGDFARTVGRKIALGTAAAAAALLAVWSLPPYLTGPGKSALIVDFPELGWAAFTGPVLPAVAAALCLLAAAAVLIAGKAKAYPVALLAVLIAANIGHYRTLIRSFEPDRAASRPARSFVASQIPDPEARIAVFSRGGLPRWLLAFWHPYRYTRSAEIPADGLVRRAMIPAGTEYAVLFGEWRLDFRPFRAAHQAGCSVLALDERIDVLKDFVGVYHDAPGWTWTGRTFAYFPDRTFRTLVLVLNERRPYFPKILDIESDQGPRRIRLTSELERIELPYSNAYRFRLDRAFSPRLLGLNKDDARALGISLREAFVRD